MKKALVIGINEYERCPLNSAVNDATTFSEIIRVNGDGTPNFAVINNNNIKTKEELLQNIKVLFNGEGDTALLYFSGHGTNDDLGGYLVTPDYTESYPGVSMNEVITLANKSNFKNRIVILDCCNSGSFGETRSNSEISEISKGLTILCACMSNETAIEGPKNGLFSEFLFDALRGGAANIIGDITIAAAYAYIDLSLGPWNQRPIFKTNITEFKPIVKVSPQIDLTILRTITKLFNVPEEEYYLDPSYEFTNTKEESGTKAIEPYAKQENVDIFKNMQKMERVGLIKPVGTEHMYFAAMESKSCKLTALGNHYWNLVKNERI